MLDIEKILDESIKLELNIAKLYALFHEVFPHHGEIWWTLNIEEKNHASLLLTVKKYYKNIGEVPEKLLSKEFDKLEMINYEIEFLIDKFTHTPPTEEEAFDLAIQIEESVGEAEFQEFMKSSSSTDQEKVFQQLNSDNKDHVDRLRSYKKKHVLTVKQNDFSSNKGDMYSMNS